MTKDNVETLQGEETVHSGEGATGFVLCSNCGASIKEGKKFCHMCGTKIEPKPAEVKKEVKEAKAVAKEDKDVVKEDKAVVKETKKKNILVPILFVLVIGLSITCVYGYTRIMKQAKEVANLSETIKTHESTIKSQENKILEQLETISSIEAEVSEKAATIEELEYKVSLQESQISDLAFYTEQYEQFKEQAVFMDEYLALIEDDGTNRYHKYGCFYFKGNSFWAYNTVAAENNGYYPCYYCH